MFASCKSTFPSKLISPCKISSEGSGVSVGSGVSDGPGVFDGSGVSDGPGVFDGPGVSDGSSSSDAFSVYTTFTRLFSESPLSFTAITTTSYADSGSRFVSLYDVVSTESATTFPSTRTLYFVAPDTASHEILALFDLLSDVVIFFGDSGTVSDVLTHFA